MVDIPRRLLVFVALVVAAAAVVSLSGLFSVAAPAAGTMDPRTCSRSGDTFSCSTGNNDFFAEDFPTSAELGFESGTSLIQLFEQEGKSGVISLLDRQLDIRQDGGLTVSGWQRLAGTCTISARFPDEEGGHKTLTATGQIVSGDRDIRCEADGVNVASCQKSAGESGKCPEWTPDGESSISVQYTMLEQVQRWRVNDAGRCVVDLAFKNDIQDNSFDTLRSCQQAQKPPEPPGLVERLINVINGIFGTAFSTVQGETTTFGLPDDAGSFQLGVSGFGAGLQATVPSSMIRQDRVSERLRDRAILFVEQGEQVTLSFNVKSPFRCPSVASVSHDGQGTRVVNRSGKSITLQGTEPGFGSETTVTIDVTNGGCQGGSLDNAVTIQTIDPVTKDEQPAEPRSFLDRIIQFLTGIF